MFQIYINSTVKLKKKQLQNIASLLVIISILQA